MILTQRTPLITIDLENHTVRPVGKGPPKWYLETEKMNDALAIFDDGVGVFVRDPESELKFKCSSPLFTDNGEDLIIYSGGQIITMNRFFGL